MVFGGVSVLVDKLGDVVGSENMCGPIIEMAVMDIKEEDLWIDLDISTGPNYKTHCLHPATPAHISQQSSVD